MSGEDAALGVFASGGRPAVTEESANVFVAGARSVVKDPNQAPAMMLVRHSVFSSLMQYRVMDLAPLPTLGPLVKRSRAIVAQFVTVPKGLLELVLEEGVAPLRVTPEAMFERSVASKPSWHSDNDRNARRELIADVSKMLWREALVVISNSVGTPLAHLPSDCPPSCELGRFIEAQCMILERGMYYAANSLADSIDRNTLTGRLALLHSFQWRELSSRSERTAEGVASAPTPPGELQAQVRRALRESAVTGSASGGVVGGGGGVATAPGGVGFASWSEAQRASSIVRLKLLVHARFCTHSGSAPCTVFVECGTYKILWPHLQKCTDSHCPFAHCNSSKVCLMHSRCCVDVQCPVCTPLREYYKAEKHGKRPLSAGGDATNAASADPKRIRGNDFETAQALMREKAAVPRPNKRGKVDGDCTLVATFSRDVIMRHLASLRDDFNAGISCKEIRNVVLPLLQMMINNPETKAFVNPVDAIKLNVPDYFDIVKKPMDLSTICKKLDQDSYRTFSSFADDVRLVFANALLYNPVGQDVHTRALSLSTWFEGQWERYERNWFAHYQQLVASQEHCSLCGGGLFLFEPITLYCNCCNAKLRKGNVYWTTMSNKFHWCQACFTKLPKGQVVTIDDCFVEYNKLEKKRNDAEEKEHFVQCDHCRRWQHYVCTLYNFRRCVGAEPDIPHYW